MNALKNRLALKPVFVATLLALAAGQAAAIEFEINDDWKGNWNTTLSASQSWRMQDPSPYLYTPGDGRRVGLNGGVGGNNVSSGNLNWWKHDTISQVFKFITDVSIANTTNTTGALVRVKGWYDNELKNGEQHYGNQGQRPYYNGVNTPGGELSDTGLQMDSRFVGAKLMDAYVFHTFELGERPLQVKLGNQVVNWGESVFLQGLNVTSPVDLPALRRGAGTEIKEFLIPVAMLFGNLGLPNGMSLEAFYQLQWQRTVVDACGTYFAPTEGAANSQVGNCNIATTLTHYLSNPANIAANQYVQLVEGKDAKNSGQYGLAFRFPVEMLDTEFGVYYQNLHSRTPVISGLLGQSTGLRPGQVVIMIPGQNIPGRNVLQAYWEYPEDIKMFGLTGATTLGGWSTGFEYSYSKDVPVQINGNDLVGGFILGVGPMGASAYSASLANRTGGAYFRGWDLFNKHSFQANAVKLFSDVLGAENLTVIGEAGFQWNNLPDYNDQSPTNSTRRYGRGFIFGTASAPSYGGSTCGFNPAANANPQPNGCKNDGFFTDFAWGTRLRAALTYNNVFGSGITATPSVYWLRDWSGMSIDTQFVEGRNTWALGMKFDYNKKYAIDFSYVNYSNGAEYDPYFDRDFFSVGLSATF